MSACINRKAITNQNDVKVAFQILDVNKDGKISLEDFDELFCSYGGAKMDSQIWHELLKEADMNGDGVVSENEFTEAMCNIIRKSLKLRKTYKRKLEEEEKK